MAAVAFSTACHSKVEFFGEDAAVDRRDAQPFTDLFAPPADGAGPPDGPGCPAPAPKCYEGWSGSSDCCLEPGVEATCRASGWSCPVDTFRTAECGRFDPVCEGADGGPPPLYDRCDVSSDCALTRGACCDPCGVPAASDFAAVNESLAEDYYLNEACPEASDGPVICPECATAPNPHLAAYCDDTGFRPACGVLDLEADRYRTCSDDRECKLAVADCCPCGDIAEIDIVPVREDLDLEALLCDDSVSCDCEPLFPDGIEAVCAAGQCELAYGSTGP